MQQYNEKFVINLQKHKSLYIYIEAFIFNYKIMKFKYIWKEYTHFDFEEKNYKVNANEIVEIDCKKEFSEYLCNNKFIEVKMLDETFDRDELTKEEIATERVDEETKKVTPKKAK